MPGGRTAINVVLAIMVVGAPAAFFILAFDGRGLLATAVAVVFVAAIVAASRLAWPGQSPTFAVTTIGAAFALAFLAYLVAFLPAFLITIDGELCDSGNERPGHAASTAGIGAYLLVGAWAFRRPGRFIWGLPLAVVVGMAVRLAAQAILGGHYCET